MGNEFLCNCNKKEVKTDLEVTVIIDNFRKKETIN